MADKIGSSELYKWQLDLVKKAFADGKRSTNLEKEPVAWMYKALQALEKGEELTVEDIKRFQD